jgi:hypothetical protein
VTVVVLRKTTASMTLQVAKQVAVADRSSNICAEKGTLENLSSQRMCRHGECAHELRGTEATFRPLGWHSAPTIGHHPPWPPPSSTSACAGSSVSSHLSDEANRTRTSRSWCSGTRSGFSNVSCTRWCGIARRIGRSLLGSVVCSLEPGGGPTWSPPKRCCDGTGMRPSAGGGSGEANGALAGHR